MHVPSLRPGDRVPDRECERPDGSKTRLHTELGPEWTVLARSGRPNAERSTKEDLFAQAIESAREDLPDTPDAGRPPEALPEVIADLLPQWGEILAEPRFRTLTARLLGAGPSHPRLLEAYVRHHLEPRRERIRAAMVQAQAAGVLSPTDDIDVLVDMMNGAIMQHCSSDPNSPTRPSSATTSDACSAKPDSPWPEPTTTTSFLLTTDPRQSFCRFR